MESFGEHSRNIHIFSHSNITFPQMSPSPSEFLCVCVCVSQALSPYRTNGPKTYYSPFCPPDSTVFIHLQLIPIVGRAIDLLGTHLYLLVSWSLHLSGRLYRSGQHTNIPTNTCAYFLVVRGTRCKNLTSLLDELFRMPQTALQWSIQKWYFHRFRLSPSDMHVLAWHLEYILPSAL